MHIYVFWNNIPKLTNESLTFYSAVKSGESAINNHININYIFGSIGT